MNHPDDITQVERSVIRVLLNDAEAYVPVSVVLPDARMFGDARSAAVYRAIGELAKAAIMPTVATVADHMGLALAEVQALATGYDSHDAEAVVYLAEEVAKEGQRRLLLEALAEATEMASQPTEDVQGLAYTAMQMVAGTSAEMSGRRDASITAALAETDDMIRHAAGHGGMLGYKTHLRWINDRTYGMSSNSVWVISGPYGGRKTTVAHNLVIDALRDGAAVSYFALEGGSDITAASLWSMLATDRLLKWNKADEAHLSSKFLLLNLRTEAQNEALAEARQELLSWKDRLFIYDGRDGIYSEGGIAVKARHDRLLHRMDVFVVDYVQLIGEGKLFDRLETATHNMQRLIRELDVCGILLVQLNESAIWEIGSDSGRYSAGVKGGGDPAQAADYLFRVYPHKDNHDQVMLELKKARYSRSHVSVTLEVNPPSGWLIGEVS